MFICSLVSFFTCLLQIFKDQLEAVKADLISNIKGDIKENKRNTSSSSSSFSSSSSSSSSSSISTQSNSNHINDSFLPKSEHQQEKEIVSSSPYKKRKTPICNSSTKKKKLNEEKQKELDKEQKILLEQSKLQNEKLIKLSFDNKSNITTSLATVTAVEYEIQCICSVFGEAFELLRDSNISLSISFNSLSKKKILKNVCVSNTTETDNFVTERVPNNVILDKNEEKLGKEDENNQVKKFS